MATVPTARLPPSALARSALVALSVALSVAAVLAACGSLSDGPARAAVGSAAGGPPPGFCGSSTGGACQADGDCSRQGCSAQVCAARFENAITTCEWRECYDPGPSGAICGCSEGGCRWR